MPHLLLSAAKVIVFSEYSKRKALFCAFFLIKTEFYFVFSFIWCIFVAMMMKKVIRTDSWIIKINNDNETCFFDNGSWQFTASEGIAVDAR